MRFRNKKVRNEKIYEMYETGIYSYRELAKKVNLSVERVRQIYIREVRKLEFYSKIHPGRAYLKTKAFKEDVRQDMGL